MYIERPPGPEKKAPALTQVQYEKFTSCTPEDPELLQWMKDNSVGFDSGIIDVEIDGKPARIHTAKLDFGTMVYEEEPAAPQVEETKGYSPKVMRAVMKAEARIQTRGVQGGYKRFKIPGE